MRFYLSIFSIFCLTSFQCILAQVAPTETLLMLGDKEVTVEEFNHLYRKNHLDSANAYSRASLEAYLPLFINFKLKVMAAEEQNLGDTKAFKNEFESYRRQLAKPYLTDENSNEVLLKEAYERLQREVKASHILVLVEPDADSTEAYQKIVEIREKAVNGADFDELAQEYSADPSAKTNQGNLGYFSALQMVYPFENAAYNTAVGEISQPVRTKFGYHILKVTDKRPAQGTVVAAHIMIRTPKGSSEEDSLQAYQKAQEIYQQLQQDSSRWNQLCQQFSDDPRSKANNGKLPPFSVGQMPPTFAEAAFALSESGEISQPVKTDFGWHIIKLIGKQPLAPMAELRESLLSKITQDARSQVRHATFIARLKQQYNYQENPENINQILTVFDSTLLKGAWNYDKAQPWDNFLFSVAEQSYNESDFLAFAKEQQRMNLSATVASYAKALFTLFVEKRVLAEEEKNLPKKYSEYKNLVQEYYEGMLFFEIMQKEVWQKAAADSAGLAMYYEQNKEKYRWQKRAKGSIINAESEELLQKVLSAKNQNVFPTTESQQVISFAIDTASQNLASDTRSGLNDAVRKLKRYKKYILKITLSEQAEVWEEIIKNYLNQQNVEQSRFFFESDNVNDEELILSYFSISLRDLQNSFNAENNALAVQIEEGWFEIATHPVISTLPPKKGEYRREMNNRFYAIDIEELEEARQKEFTEAKGSIIADYQKYLEEQWLEELREKYNPQVKKRILNAMIKK